MTINEQKEAGYITLKEASERFGYAPDYIGQLIRKGKVEGKQVYANVAWMTTASAIEEYIAEERGSGKRESKPTSLVIDNLLERLSEWICSPRIMKIATALLYSTLVLLIFASLILFYFLSIAIEHKLEERAEERLAAKPLVAILPAYPSKASTNFYAQ